MTIDELISSFNEMEDWEERCDALIDMGFELPDFPAEEKTEQNKVHGCQSNVWMIANQPGGKDSPIEILADSDAMIVKGLIAVLLTVYSGKTPDEIIAIDIHSIFNQLSLSQHLSSARRNGLFGMVKRIHQYTGKIG